jgi:hypothetical protein
LTRSAIAIAPIKEACMTNKPCQHQVLENYGTAPDWISNFQHLQHLIISNARYIMSYINYTVKLEHQGFKKWEHQTHFRGLGRET